MSVLINVTSIQINRGQIPGVPSNPRRWSRSELDNLKKSIVEDVELLHYRPLLVYLHNGKYVIIGGNMRFSAVRELGWKEVPCIVIPEMDTEKLRRIAIKDNGSFGDWDFDMLANEWDDLDLKDMGVDIPVWGEDAPTMDSRNDEEEMERKKKEFEERMAAGEISEEDEEYQEFLKKFELKKTTDDCYTPTIVYDAVADWVANEYGLNKADFVRPFYPGGDYENEKYPTGCVVVDNPPFSILAEIVRFYDKKGIKFFLFAPHLTLLSSSSICSICTCMACGVGITYENGAVVNTSFLTNIPKDDMVLISCPSLYEAVDKANTENMRQQRKELPKYIYDDHVVLVSWMSKLSSLGISFEIPRSECAVIRQLDSQKEYGKAIFGSGILINEHLKAEREKAEREKAEREKAEREKAEREKAERAVIWELSEREWKIVKELS